MEKQQAEAIAKTILEPDLNAQAELRRKREAENRSLAVRRFIAGFVLVGFAIGAAAAFFTGERFTVGGLWGGIGGAAVGWVVGAWRDRRRAA
ncbi:hypothetical protein [Luteimonas sp. J29]|uniref:hypothetical protein n=1 Tax=Luteimonas sp. J29 TaxID=935863 RepID=UPI000684D111|nr:hypothetical protein [Luteimonas sp. J29]